MARQPRVRSKNALEKQRNQQFLEWLTSDERNLELYRQFNEEHQNQMQRNQNTLNRKLGVLERRAGSRDNLALDYQRYFEQTGDRRYLDMAEQEKRNAEMNRLRRNHMATKLGGDGATPYNDYDRVLRNYLRNRQITQVGPVRVNMSGGGAMSSVGRGISAAARALNPMRRLVDIANLLLNPMEAQAPTAGIKVKNRNIDPLIAPDAIKKDDLYDKFKNTRNRQT
ncbi:hypothetical protein UFOVP453_3 [uncultured Caudovirales phage]|uniref:Uncharacterized protein n=1 Tax=uncultured Caudovirales phage TaxID=2100421 RepID=A0A6J5MCD5_9CAUD|nr:hypothetical protein UFOVP453_3 [uncultured Caudovirales phage]